jgi:hypothetical protein
MLNLLLINLKDPSFEAGFNTPKHRVKASIGNEKLFPNFGFNIRKME